MLNFQSRCPAYDTCNLQPALVSTSKTPLPLQGSQPIQILPQRLDLPRPLLLRLRHLEQLDGKIPLGSGVFHPGVEVLPAHVPLHHPGIIFLVRPLIDLPRFLRPDLVLKNCPRPNLPACPALLARRGSGAVHRRVPLLMEEPTSTQPALPR